MGPGPKSQFNGLKTQSCKYKLLSCYYAECRHVECSYAKCFDAVLVAILLLNQ